MSYRAIALSQVDGAGGESIGLEVAQQLGFGYLNEGIIARVARDHDLELATVSEAERQKSFFARVLESTALGAASSVDLVPPVSVFEGAGTLLTLIRDAVRSAAERGNAVLVAHAACYACADRSDVLRVCVTAPFASRVARFAADRGVSEEEATKVLRQSDTGRARYLKRVYGVEESPTDYDVVINTDRLTSQAAVDLIVGLVGSHPVIDEPGYGQAAVGQTRS